MKKVNTLLGLAEDASVDASIAEIQKIRNRATTAEGTVQMLTAERDGLLVSLVDADLEKYAAVITNKEAAKKTLIANRASAVEFFDGLIVATNEARADKISNRARDLRNSEPKLSLSKSYEIAEQELADDSK